MMHLLWLLTLFIPAVALAHGAAPHEDAAPSVEPRTMASLPWGSDWWSWLLLAVTITLYVVGFARVWRTASPRLRVLHRRDAVCFVLGWLTLFVALVSPLHPWGQELFSAHMVQHELLMVIAAPLLVLGRPYLAFTRALPAGMVRRLLSKPLHVRPMWRIATLPLVAWAVHAVALWIWHLPSLFQATLTNDLIHTAQHVCFFGTALLFWWSLLRGRPGAAGYGAAILYLFTTAAHSGALGALMTVARRVWYPAYAATAPAWGLTALEDQQLGGLFMWVPAGTIYAAVALILLVAWLGDTDRRELERELRADRLRRAEQEPELS
jgi:putative membrane protein